MSGPNALEIKEKILQTIRRRGPSLPVHVAKETGLSILFASAFLSELVADKKIKYSDMKVGSSPLYFINEQAYMLERFSQYLNSREKDAFLLLKDKKFLMDKEQSPVIRVALRAIKDFAIPFTRDNQGIWRYYIVPESDFKEELLEKRQEKKPIEEINVIEKPAEKLIEVIQEKPIEIKIERIEKQKEAKKERQKELPTFDKQKKGKAKKQIKKNQPKVDDNFFNKVKEWVMKNSMEIIDIKNFNKNELHLKIKREGKEHLLVAYNKKRITDFDILKAHKKAKELGYGYSLLSFGELQKKMSDIIDAVKNLSEIKRME